MIEPYYQDDYGAVYHGDCMDVMAQLGRATIDLVVTSPPYNKQITAHWGSNSLWKATRLAQAYTGHSDDMTWDDYVAWQHAMLTECWQLLTPTGAIFYNHKPHPVNKNIRTPFDLNPGLPLRQIIIWISGAKVNYSCSHYAPAHEWIMLFAKPDFNLVNRSASRYSDVWQFPPARNNPHPAPFPVALPLRAIGTTTAHTILDPFSGSGTTGVACKLLGRHYILIEQSLDYCAIAAKRLRETQPMMDFDAAPLAYTEALL